MFPLGVFGTKSEDVNALKGRWITGASGARPHYLQLRGAQRRATPAHTRASESPRPPPLPAAAQTPSRLRVDFLQSCSPS